MCVIMARDEIFTLYRNLKLLREKHGLTTKQLAEILCIDERRLILAESCTQTGCLLDLHIKRAADFFQVKPDALFKPDSFA